MQTTVEYYGVEMEMRTLTDPHNENDSLHQTGGPAATSDIRRPPHDRQNAPLNENFNCILLPTSAV